MGAIINQCPHPHLSLHNMNRKVTPPKSLPRRFVDLVGWIGPGAVLALIPKCPVCFAAYIALWTGIGLSLSGAMYLRASVVVLCTGLMVFLAARSARCLVHKFCQCETRTKRSA